MKTAREWAEIALERIRGCKVGDEASQKAELEITIKEAIDSHLQASRDEQNDP